MNKSTKIIPLFVQNDYRYAVYEHKMVFDDDFPYSRFFIVIKNQYGLIVHFTNFHRFCGVYTERIYRPLVANAREKLLYICRMLNYVVAGNKESLGVVHVFQVQRTMLEKFFRDYALEKQANGHYRSKQSIEKCVKAVTEFFGCLLQEYSGYMSIREEEIFEEKKSYGRREQTGKRITPSFQVTGISEIKRIFRDIPTKVFGVILHQAYKHIPEIAFAIAVQAFAGLRPCEALNLRQEQSPLGSGLSLTNINGKVTSVTLDLTHEYKLRSDGVSVGGIKKERKQKIYPAFLSAFTSAYKKHKSYLAEKNFEVKYCPMFVNKRGMALTYKGYNDRFQRLMTEYVRPSLLKSNDAECQLFGQMLMENPLGMHAFRHWFSVQLVLQGEDIAQIQYWRGDSNPESALNYLQNKGELIAELSEVSNRFAEMLMGGCDDE